MAIPKIIHYCWFGKKPLDELSVFCIQSWKRYLKDYQIIKWDEENFDINSILFVKEAYEQKKWAFVSDYVRAWALEKIGGVYLDTDVEIRKELDSFLSFSAFSGFEKKGLPFTALWASEKHHHWPRKVLNYYNQQNSFVLCTNTAIVSHILEADYKVDRFNDCFQLLSDNIAIFPSSYFCLDVKMLVPELKEHYACHHFNSSWVVSPNDNKIDGLYKKQLRTEFLLNDILYKEGSEIILNFLLKKENFNILLSQMGPIAVVSRVARRILSNIKQKYLKHLSSSNKI